MSRWKSRLVGGGMLLMAGGAALVGSAAVGVSGAAGTATMAITPATQNVALGSDPFTVDVTVADVEDLTAYDVTMKFNPNVLEYVGYSTGNYLTSTGRVQNCIGPKNDPHGGTTVVQNVNNNGAFHFGCTTIGDDAVVPGPTGSGVIGSATFRPKTVGQSDLAFVGTQAGSPYEIRAPGAPVVIDGVSYDDNGDYGATGLGGAVNSQTGADDLHPDTVDAVVAVYDPSQPTPTGVPPTSTPKARATVNTQATVNAALGTPERTLTTPVPGTGGAEGVINGPDVGADGSPGSSGGGSARGSGTASAGTLGRSASGAPIAGYGPEPKNHSRWPLAVGGGMLVMGAIALAAGVAGERRRA